MIVKNEPVLDSFEAEKALIGVALQEAPSIVPLAQKHGITEKSFSSGPMQELWSAILQLVDAGEHVDAVTISTHLRKNGSQSPFSVTISECMDAGVVSGAAEHYVAIIREVSQRRRLLDVCGKIQELARDPSLKPEDAGLQIIEHVAKITRRINHKTNAQHIDDVLAAWGVKHDAGIRAEREPGYTIPLSGPSFGFPEPDWNNKRWVNNLSNEDQDTYQGVDQVLQGMQPGYYILAGRPSAGKTSFGNHVALQLAAEGHHVAMCSIDLSARRLLGRMICNSSGTSLAQILKGYVRDEKWRQVLQHGEWLKSLPGLHILENQSGLYEWAAWVRLMHAQHGIKAAFIDYVQQLRGKTRSQSLDDRMSEVSEVVKSLAGDLQIPIVALAQFNRQAERDDRPPTLADLRGSGSFEQDAMVAILLYKLPRFFYDANPLSEWHEKNVRAVVFDIAKSQDGETGRIPFFLRGAYFKPFQAPPRWGLTEEELKLCWNPAAFDKEFNGK